MNTSVAQGAHPAALAFDSMAAEYDRVFTRSIIGRAQRAQVWRKVATTFKRGDRVLELNCGTGEDAFFMAGRGISVQAFDASGEMIRIARQRHEVETPELPVRFEQLDSESLHSLQPEQQFDGVFSNFSGLNCVADLRAVARQVARMLMPGASALLCISARICTWEVLWYLAHGDVRRAFRRWPGTATAFVNGHQVLVRYPTVRNLRRSFEPWFALRSITGIGVLVPPSYIEAWAQRNSRSIDLMSHADCLLSRVPFVRVLGDHILLHLERTAVS